MEQNQKALESLRLQVEEGKKIREEFFSRESENVVRVARMMGDCINAGGKLLLCGNGGSAADAVHFSGEMIGRMMRERRPLPAICLSADISAITAVGNDYGYDHIFSRGVEAFGRKGDILFAISTSGKSPNVLRAADAAKSVGMKVVALTGFQGGPLASKADAHLNVALGKNSPRIQEVHIQVIHLLVDLMDEFFLERLK